MTMHVNQTYTRVAKSHEQREQEAKRQRHIDTAERAGRFVGAIVVILLVLAVLVGVTAGLGWVIVALVGLISGGAIALTLGQGAGIVALLIIIGLLTR